MAQILNKIGMEWNRHPEAFGCRLARSEEPDPEEPTKTVIVWRLTTGYDVLTSEGERIHQDEEWVLPSAAVTIAENIRTHVTNRVKQRNDIS